jgi:sugar phosphate isomerase/epimerase
LSGRINHIHLIDIDDRGCSGEQREGEIGARLPLGDGRLDLDALVAALAKEETGHDWWTIDLDARPDVWEASARCKAVVDELNRKYG